jgi:AcrR family transcriptional regulator
MAIKSWKRAQVLGTRAHLLETAAGLFGDQGYARTALEQVVGEAGLTRGAVYHHFKDKRALFDAVVDQTLRSVVEAVERETVRRAVERGAERQADAIELFVDALGDGRSHQILCLDGPAVLGRERWSELMESRLLDAVRRVVQKGADRGRLGSELVPSVSHLLLGAILEAALLVGVGGRPEVRREDLDAGLGWLLERILGPAG